VAERGQLAATIPTLGKEDKNKSVTGLLFACGLAVYLYIAVRLLCFLAWYSNAFDASLRVLTVCETAVGNLC